MFSANGIEATKTTNGEGHDNAPGLFNQTEFNNFSHPRALEFNPNKADRDHLSKLGVTDKDIQDAQQGRYENETGPKEARGISLKKKVRLAQRERAKRLFEARRLLQSTTPPPDNSTTAYPLTCLSQVHGSKISYKLSDNGAILGKKTTIFPRSYVRNDCPGDVVDVKFQLTAIPECRGRPTNNQQWTFDASPSVLVPGETAAGGASDSKGFTFQCVRWSSIGPVDTSFPTSLWVELKASGKLVEVRQRRSVEGKTFYKDKLI